MGFKEQRSWRRHLVVLGGLVNSMIKGTLIFWKM
jgi:hypothetical protein